MKLRRRPISRWALWLFAAALLLKAAMPMLATASAEVQGKALVEVCTVYGMSMVAVDGGGGGSGSVSVPTSPKPDDVTAHLDHQCALTALAALATADDPQPFAAADRLRSAGPPPAALALDPGHDAAAAWLARRKQEPPNFS